MSFLSGKEGQPSDRDRLSENMLTQSREKRVEELEKRLKLMEDQLKRAIEEKQCEVDEESRDSLIELETPSPSQSQAGPSYLIKNIQSDDLLDPTFTIAGVSPQAPAFGVPFQNGNFKYST